MGWLIEELKRREAAARAEADRLRARIEELSGDLARAEEQVSGLAITREEVRRVLEEPPAADPARRETGACPGNRGGDGAAVAGGRRGIGAAAGLSGSSGSGRRRGAPAACGRARRPRQD